MPLLLTKVRFLGVGACPSPPPIKAKFGMQAGLPGGYILKTGPDIEMLNAWRGNGNGDRASP